LAAGIGTEPERSKRESRRFGAECRVCPLPIRAAHNLTYSIHRTRIASSKAAMPLPVAPAARRRPRTVGMVSFDVPFARIDAKGLGNDGVAAGI